MHKFGLNEVDKFIYNNEIKPFLPNRIFDAHTHLFLNEFYPDIINSQEDRLNNIDVADIKSWWKMLFPDAKVNGLIMGFPKKGCNVKAINKYLSKNIKKSKNRFSILAHPLTSWQELEQEILKIKPHGLKPYMCFSSKKNVNDSDICDMIPESQIALANKYRLAITLHVAKPRGMADSGNIKGISRLIKQYPQCNFILAHCGRCFITPNMEQALKKLPAAKNLWIDTSAVCDTGVFLNLFKKYDLSQIIFGTDLVTASGFKGTYVRLGMSWDMCEATMVQRPGGQQLNATFAAYENLCAMLTAAKFCQLSKKQLNGIFFNNAARLFKL